MVKYEPTQVKRFAESLKTNSLIKNLPVDLLEKDIWITYILRETRSLSDSKYLAFRGGTCLVKAYLGYYRFSEDIDLTWRGPKIHRRVFRQQVMMPVMDKLSLEWNKHDRVPTGIVGTHSGGVMSYFLLSPQAGSAGIKLKVTVAFDEQMESKPRLLNLQHVPLTTTNKRELSNTFGDIGADYFGELDFWCYRLTEIACEKIRAILTRKLQFARSRDLVDLFRIANGRKLQKVAPAAMVTIKMKSAMKIRSYVDEFKRTTRDLGNHLEQLVSESQSDQVFLEKVRSEPLTKFREELESYLREDILTKIKIE